MNTGMLRKMFGFATQQTPFDASRFNDPLALKVEWTPATRGGSNFRTHRLVQVDFTRVEFHATTSAKIFYSLFAIIGLGVAAAFLLGQKATPSTNVEEYMPVFVGFFFAIISGILFYSGTTPIVFDKGNGYFWRGRKGPQDVVEVTSLKKYALLDQVHALQLVSEWVRGNKSAYYSYELNLVLDDARRLTVIDHGNLPKLREDAGKLSAFLGKPVWDAIPQ